jgi:restriction endonuclease Mrr
MRRYQPQLHRVITRPVRLPTSQLDAENSFAQLLGASGRAVPESLGMAPAAGLADSYLSLDGVQLDGFIIEFSNGVVEVETIQKSKLDEDYFLEE